MLFFILYFFYLFLSEFWFTINNIKKIRVLNRFTWLLICLFVCLTCLFGYIVLLENFSLIWRRHHYRWRVVSDLCLTLMAIEQWRFFSVPHQLCTYCASVYNGHLLSEDSWQSHLLPSVTFEEINRICIFIYNVDIGMVCPSVSLAGMFRVALSFPRLSLLLNSQIYFYFNFGNLL